MSTKDKQSHRGEPDLVIEMLKNRISSLEKQMIHKDAIINFLLLKSIISTSPERKFRNKQIDHLSKEDECASTAANTRSN